MQVECPYCEAPLNVDTAPGLLRCGECSREFQVPGGEAVVCPGCGAVLHPPAGAKVLVCGECRRRIDLGPEQPVPQEEPRSSSSRISFPPEEPSEKAESSEETSFIDGPQGYERDRLRAIRQEFADRYEVLESIGHGGMGAIYKAKQRQPERIVVLKVMLNGRFSSPRYRIRFEREAQAVARLKHPGIVSVYEFGEVNGQPYFTMEYVEGYSIKEYAVRHTLDKRQICELMTKVCRAVAYAHQRGVIHRDIKPNNILVDGEGNPRLLDFGLARLAGDCGDEQPQMSEAGEVMGTPSYMSPEQTLGRPDEIDVRSDVYSLGVLFYELAADTLPYHIDRTRPLESLRTIREYVPKRPSAINPRVDGDLDSIVMKCLEKERDLRYQSAVELSEDIGRYLKGQPVEARPSTTFYHFRKLLWRHRSFVLPVCGMVVVIVVLTGFVVWRVAAAGTQARLSAQEAEAATEQARRKREELVGFLVELQAVRRKVDALMAEGRWEDAYRIAQFAEKEMPPESGMSGLAQQVRASIAQATADEAKKIGEVISALRFHDARERIQRLKLLAERLDLSDLATQVDQAARNFDESCWQSLFTYIRESKRSARALQRFLTECPGNAHAAEARTILNQLINGIRFAEWPLDAESARRNQRQTAEVLDAPVRLDLELPGGGTIPFCLVPAGQYVMGSSGEGKGFNDDQEPEHTVRIADPFYISATELTCRQFEAVTGRVLPAQAAEGSQEKAGSLPAAVSWEDAQSFCDKLSRSNRDRLAVRLPTEAEWEYACRAGSEGLYAFGNGTEALGQWAWYGGNSSGGPQPVGQGLANAWGLHDMHGNMAEWCQDWYDPRYYLSSPIHDPKGPAEGAYKVLRGGSWADGPEEVRSAYRKAAQPEALRPTYGLRVCVDVFSRDSLGRVSSPSLPYTGP